MEVKIYYNDVVIGNPSIVRENCPRVSVPIEDAKKIAEDKMKAGDWVSFLIPELSENEVIFEGGQ